MPRFTAREYADIHFVYGFCDGNTRAAVVEYQRRFPARRQPHRRVFQTVHRLLCETGSVLPRQENLPRRLNVRMQEAILHAVNVDPSTSTRRIARQLGVSQSVVWRTLHDEHLHPYHFQGVQALHAGDAGRRLAFCRWLLERTEHDQDFCRNIIWTDESTFTRMGIYNQHNEHQWEADNPHATRESAFQQRFSVNVWAAIVGNQLLDLHVIEGNLNTASFIRLLDNTVVPYMDGIPLVVLRRLWFQLDGAPAHYGREARAWLDRQFPQQWIGRAGPIPWPARSPDLTPLDFYLWGHMKQLVYGSEIPSREVLLARIHNAVEEIRRGDGLGLLCASVLRRCRACIDATGGHFEHLG